MKEQEASVNSITEQKAKIRLRYQGIDPNLLVVLPAKTETGPLRRYRSSSGCRLRQSLYR